jgi:hypothetical protein
MTNHFRAIKVREYNSDKSRNKVIKLLQKVQQELNERSILETLTVLFFAEKV